MIEKNVDKNIIVIKQSNLELRLTEKQFIELAEEIIGYVNESLSNGSMGAKDKLNKTKLIEECPLLEGMSKQFWNDEEYRDLLLN